jgi:hypothetical protein
MMVGTRRNDRGETKTMPLCVYLCYTAGCQQKVERWMLTAEEGRAARVECPRCGEPMRCAWTGYQAPTPNLKSAIVPDWRSED